MVVAYLPAGPNAASVKRKDAGAMRVFDASHRQQSGGGTKDHMIQPPLLRSDGGVWGLPPLPPVLTEGCVIYAPSLVTEALLTQPWTDTNLMQL